MRALPCRPTLRRRKAAVALGFRPGRAWPLVGLLLLSASACGLFGPKTPPGPPAEALQHFNCYGQAAGERAYAGALTLRVDGSTNFNAQEGTWTYDGATAAFTFSPELDLATATLDPDGHLRASLRAGIVLATGQSGELVCEAK